MIHSVKRLFLPLAIIANCFALVPAAAAHKVSSAPNAAAETKKESNADELLPGFNMDPKKMAAGFESGCKEGKADQCVSLAEIHRQGSLGEKRDDLARELYVRACVLKPEIGCNEAGKMAARPIGGGRDMPYAVKAFADGCAAGDAKACTNVAVLQQHGDGVERDEVTARASYLKICRDSRIQAACHNLAGMMLRGTGGKKDESGLRLYKANCDEGYQASCNLLKRHQDNAAAVAEDASE